MANGITITGVGQLHVPTQDQARAIAFYRDVLGLDFQFEVPGMAFFKVGAVMLMLGPVEGEDFDDRSSLVYYDVEDIDGAWGHLVAAGVAAIREPQLTHKEEHRELWLAFFRDTEGNPLALRQWR